MYYSMIVSFSVQTVLEYGGKQKMTSKMTAHEWDKVAALGPWGLMKGREVTALRLGNELTGNKTQWWSRPCAYRRSRDVGGDALLF